MPTRQSADPAGRLAEEIRQPRAVMVGRQRGVDLGQLCLRLGSAEQPRQHLQRLVLAALHRQIARAFRNGQQQRQEQQRRHRLHPEHPAPRCVPAPQRFGGRTRRGCQQIVGQERDGEPADDGDLLHRGQAAAVPRWRHFGDVGRRDHTRRSHRKAAHHPRDDEHGRGRRRTCADRRQQEQHCRDDQHVAAPQAVGQTAGAEGTDRAAQQHRCDLEPLHPLAGFEGLVQPVLGAVDHPAVEPEQESANRRHHADHYNQAGVLAALHCLVHYPALLRSGVINANCNAQRSRYWLIRFS